MGDVVVRDGAADFRGKPEPGGDGIRKSIAQNGSGIVVLGCAVSVRASELEAVAHPLLDANLKGLVSGIGSKRHSPDQSEVRVDPQILVAGVQRPEVSPGDLRGSRSTGRRAREDHIEIIASYYHVDAMGADITHRGRQAGRDLALHVDIPLLDVISFGIRVIIRAGERTNPQRRLARRVIRWSEARVRTPWIAGRNAKRPGERRNAIGNGGREQKRRPTLTVKVSGQRQDVKDGEAAPNGHLPLAARIPGKTNSRLKILGGGVRVIRGGA